MAALSANVQPVGLGNSEGYTAYCVFAQWNIMEKTEQEEMMNNKSKLDKWLYQTFGIPPDAARIKAVIRNENWRSLCFRFVSTRYGEAAFNWALISRMLGNRLDFVS